MMTITAAQLRNPDVCAYCLEVHAGSMAMENFEDSRGFSIYDLSLYADVVPSLNWDTITPGSQFEQAYEYLMDVGADYLRYGDVICECEDRS